MYCCHNAVGMNDRKSQADLDFLLNKYEGMRNVGFCILNNAARSIMRKSVDMIWTIKQFVSQDIKNEKDVDNVCKWMLDTNEQFANQISEAGLAFENVIKLHKYTIECVGKGKTVADKIKNSNAGKAREIERLCSEIMNKTESGRTKMSSIEVNMNNILADQEIIDDNIDDRLASFKMLYSNNGGSMFFDVLDNMVRCAGFVKLLENTTKELTDMYNDVDADCRNLMSIIGEIR